MRSQDFHYFAEPSLVEFSGDGSDVGQKDELNSADELRKGKDVVRILVVEDHEMARKAICDLVRREEAFEVVCEAANGLEGIEAAQKLKPDIVILDITMPTMGGIEAAAHIHRVARKARIVFLSQHNSDKVAQAALATGAHAYVLKSSAGKDLIRAIRAAVAGQRFRSKLA